MAIDLPPVDATATSSVVAAATVNEPSAALDADACAGLRAGAVVDAALDVDLDLDVDA